MIPATLFAGALIAQGAFLLGAIGWLLWTQARERRDLLNRIMARDYAEYQRGTQPREPSDKIHNPIGRSLAAQKQAPPE